MKMLLIKLVSHDNRLSSEALNENLIKGLLETGINVIDYGLTTTPMHYYARHINNLYGIMITASHNPACENGFKFSFDEYANARGSMIKEFKNYIEKGKFLSGNGKLEPKNIKEDYINYVLNNLKFGKRQIKVVLDPANGVTTTIARDIYSKLNIDLTIINEENDGTFPNHHPDPSIEDNLDMLKKEVKKKKADIGIGFDGDGDRIGIIDEKGNLVAIEDYSIMELSAKFNNDNVSIKNYITNIDNSLLFIAYGIECAVIGGCIVYLITINKNTNKVAIK